jgi:hypothetical protein
VSEQKIDAGAGGQGQELDQDYFQGRDQEFRGQDQSRHDQTKSQVVRLGQGMRRLRRIRPIFEFR